MVDRVASIGSSKGELAVVKNSSSEQIFSSIFILLWNSSWRRYLAFKNREVYYVLHVNRCSC